MRRPYSVFFQRNIKDTILCAYKKEQNITCPLSSKLRLKIHSFKLQPPLYSRFLFAICYPCFLFALSFSNIVIANIAMENPRMQIAVPLNEIAEFINPVIPFTTDKIIKPIHIANAAFDIVV